MSKFEYNIEGNYGHGFELLHCEETRKSALRSIKIYRENEPDIAFRIRRVKTPLEQRPPTRPEMDHI